MRFIVDDINAVYDQNINMFTARLIEYFQQNYDDDNFIMEVIDYINHNTEYTVGHKHIATEEAHHWDDSWNEEVFAVAVCDRIDNVILIEKYTI